MTPEEFKQKYSRESYLGDGLYVHFDGYQFWLRAPREYGDHEVALEPPVFDELLKYRAQVYIDANLIEHEGKDEYKN
jgi:hypothetical protein